MVYDKGDKNTWWGKNSLFSKWNVENWLSTCKKMKLNPDIIPYTKDNLKWIKDLNIRPEIIRLLEENRQKSSSYWSWQWFLGYATRTQPIKAKIDKWGYMKLKNFCAAKETTVKRAAYGMWENICKPHTWGLGLISRIKKWTPTAQHQKQTRKQTWF